MSTSVVPALVDALVTQATAELPDIQVYDGFGISEDPGDFLMIGVEDPDNENAAFSADWSQSWAGLGNHARDEEGTITCAALSWNGDANQKAARDGVFATLAALETLLREDPTLGVITTGWVQMGGSLQLSQAQSEAGADALLVFQVHFKARI